MKFGGKIQSTIYLGEQGHDAADGHIHVHDFLQDLVGNLLENLAADKSSKNHGGQTVNVGGSYCRCYESVCRSKERHH